MDAFHVFLPSATNEEADRVANTEKKYEDVVGALEKDTGFSEEEVETYIDNMEAAADEEEAMMDEMIADINKEMAAGAETMAELSEAGAAISQKELEDLKAKESS